MKFRNYLQIIILLFTFSFIASCDDDNESSDTEKPVINLISPEEGAILKIGSDIHFNMELSDNVMLASYKVEIHNNFDGHGHDRSATVEEETVPFSYNKSWDVSGHRNKDVHHHEIVISENATPGDYHLMVYCTDAAGNESYVARNIVLSHDGEEHHHEH